MNHVLRRERIARWVREQNLAGLLVTAPVNVTYLTGFSGDSSYLLIGANRTTLVSDGRYEQQLREECPDLHVHIRPPAVKLPNATAAMLTKLGWRTVGFESAAMTVAEFAKFQELAPAVAWKACDETVEKLRMVKDEWEIGQIREAIVVAERAFARWQKSLKPDDTEKQLSDRMEMLLREEGAREGSFTAIVGIDERAALPHAPLTDKPLGRADMVLLDWGAAGRFYKSDLTRVLTRHTISPKLALAHEVVLRAQEQAIRKIRPGVKAQDVDAEARAVIQEASFGEFFSHGLGHGIGLQVHEGPALRPGSETILEPGMVTTVEPGIYLPGLGGIRIEDDVLVTADGCEVLTSVPRILDFRFRFQICKIRSVLLSKSEI